MYHVNGKYSTVCASSISASTLIYWFDYFKAIHDSPNNSQLLVYFLVCEILVIMNSGTISISEFHAVKPETDGGGG